MKENQNSLLKKLIKRTGNSGPTRKVEAGHFQQQGLHYSGHTYPDLMRIHHTGINFKTGERYTPRPVLSILRGHKSRLKNHPRTKQALSDWSRSTLTSRDDNKLLTELGKVMVSLERRIIGNLSYLPLTTNITPLQLTGDLRNAVSFRTSTKGKVISPHENS